MGPLLNMIWFVLAGPWREIVPIDQVGDSSQAVVIGRAE